MGSMGMISSEPNRCVVHQNFSTPTSYYTGVLHILGGAMYLDGNGTLI